MKMNIDQQYCNLVREILETGQERPDRTGTGTIGLFAKDLEFNLLDGFPMLNTKQVGGKWALVETLWMFVQGSSDMAYLDKHKVSIWDEWCQTIGDWSDQDRDFVWVPSKTSEELHPFNWELYSLSLKDLPQTEENKRLANSWSKMINRCYNPKAHNFKFYGAKGVKVHTDWHDVVTFIKDVKTLPNYSFKKHSWNDYELDKDYYGSNIYSKDTCIFLHTSENNLYTGKPFEVTVNNHKTLFLSIQQASKKLRIPSSTLQRWLVLGYVPSNVKGKNKRFKNYTFTYVEKEGMNLRLALSKTIGNVYGPILRGKVPGIENQVDQIAYVIDLLKNDPYSRRICMSAWDPDYLPIPGKTFEENVMLGRGVLAPCHSSFIQFYVSDKTADYVVQELIMSGHKPAEFDGLTTAQAIDKFNLRPQCLNAFTYQRSGDLGLGIPFNLLQISSVTEMLAQVTGYSPCNVKYTIGDVHIYKDHIEGLSEQIQRTPLDNYPRLKLNPLIRDFNDFQLDDFSIEGYQHQGKIILPVSV